MFTGGFVGFRASKCLRYPKATLVTFKLWALKPIMPRDLNPIDPKA